MAEVRTRDEALAAVDTVLGQWAGSAAGVLAQAAASVAGTRAAVASEASRRSSRVAARRQFLGSLRPDDERRGAAERDLAAAEASHQAALLVISQVDSVAQRVAALQRSQVRTAEAQVSAARADLRRRGAGLGAYRAAGGVGGGGAGIAPAGGGGPAGGASAVLAAGGMTEFDVRSARFFDGPGSVTFPWHAMSLADFRWAAQTWDTVIRPGLDRGMTRDDFAARDQARGARAGRRAADVYDMFLRGDHIRLERQPDGTLLVTEGRHRVMAALGAGIVALPGEVSG